MLKKIASIMSTALLSAFLISGTAMAKEEHTSAALEHATAAATLRTLHLSEHMLLRH